MKKYLLTLSIISILLSCREEISLDFPPTPERLVVQGSIETGIPPYIMLTRNQGYFESIDSNTYNNLFIDEADIKVFKISNNQIIDSIILNLVENIDLNGIPIFTDLNYIDEILNGNLSPNYNFSEEGYRYNLEIIWNGNLITSTTTIPFSTQLDSIWIEKTDQTNDKEYRCEIKGYLSDPDTLGNNYLLRSKRLEHWIIKDSVESILPTLKNNSDFSLLLVDVGPDILINGESFETFFPRPGQQGSFPNGNYNTFRYKNYNDSTTNGKDSILIPEDFVLIKYCQVDQVGMRFWRGVVRNSTSGGNPFSEPMNLSSNINGGMGIWTGYGTSYYKIPVKLDTTITNTIIPNIFDVF
ncbi:DUF4249 domain-containing protein [bacterium]|nr:DUF4249 domain-containing protein [bacterium]